jgi:hypothetical protein
VRCLGGFTAGAMNAGLIITTVGLGAFVPLTARMFFGVIREEPDPVAGIAMLTIPVCAVASLIFGLAFR